MRTSLIVAGMALSLGLIGGAAEAKGVVSGAAKGAVVGHFAGHHAGAGAAIGAVAGHHGKKMAQAKGK